MTYLLLAISLASDPFALAGYIAIGAISPSPWRAVRYGALWGLAVQFFVIAVGRIDILNVDAVALTTGLRVAGAALLTLLVHLVARLVRRGGGRSGGGSGGRSGGPPGGSSGGGKSPNRAPRGRRRRNLRIVR